MDHVLGQFTTRYNWILNESHIPWLTPSFIFNDKLDWHTNLIVISYGVENAVLIIYFVKILKCSIISATYRPWKEIQDKSFKCCDKLCRWWNQFVTHISVNILYCMWIFVKIASWIFFSEITFNMDSILLLILIFHGPLTLKNGRNYTPDIVVCLQ